MFSQANTGVIWAVAQKQRGGKEFLDEAVAKGEVTTKMQNGVKFYFFPSVKMENADTLSKKDSNRCCRACVRRN